MTDHTVETEIQETEIEINLSDQEKNQILNWVLGIIKDHARPIDIIYAINDWYRNCNLTTEGITEDEKMILKQFLVDNLVEL